MFDILKWAFITTHNILLRFSIQYKNNACKSKKSVPIKSKRKKPIKTYFYYTFQNGTKLDFISTTVI